MGKHMTMRPLLLCASLATILPANAQAPVMLWQKCAGGSWSDVGRGMVPTTEGGVVMIGTTESNDGDVSGNHSVLDDMWLVKLDATGGVVWQTCLGGTGVENGYSLHGTSDGGYIACGLSSTADGDVTEFAGFSDAWAVKVDASGALQWQHSFGGTELDLATDIGPTDDGGYLMVGYTLSVDGDVTGNHGQYDAWVVKMSSTGTLQWQKCLGGSFDDAAWAFEQTSDGGYIVSGSTRSNDGDVSGNHGQGDAWVVKLDAGGTLQWQRTLGGSDIDHASDILQTIDGGYVMVGSTSSNDGDVSALHGFVDVWVVKLDASGNIEWEHTYGGTGEEVGNSVQLLNGGYVVGGWTYSIDGDVTGLHNTGSPDATDVWLIGLDGLGNLQWQKCLGGGESEQAMSVRVGPTGDLFVGGYAESIDGDVNGIHGAFDVWAVKLTFEYNTISGLVFGDLNADGIYDSGEPLVAHHGLQTIGSTEATWTAADGMYDLIVPDMGNYEVEPMPLAHWSPSPATHTANFTGFLQTDALNDFAMQPVALISDLSVSIAPPLLFRPGVAAQYVIQYRNTGTNTLAPTVVLHTDPVLTYTSASVAPTSVTTDSVTWVFPLLGPLEEGSILVGVNVSQTAVLGSTISSPVTIAPVIGDADVSDNTAVWNVVVTGSYDPNDIQVDRATVDPDELVAPPFLEYIVRFQNTGTDTAFTVRIEDPVPQNAQFSSFQFVGSSHPVAITYNATNNLLLFHFNNILLPDSNTNEEASHGYLRYRMKPLSTLVLGDSILNRAAIFFDFNSPVITNTAFTVIEEPMTVVPLVASEPFTLYPNPAKGSVLVSATSSIKQATLVVTDVIGRELRREPMNGTAHALDVSDLPRGMYMITLRCASGSQAERLVLE